jgi:amino acid adenylation domain-containing protein
MWDSRHLIDSAWLIRGEPDMSRIRSRLTTAHAAVRLVVHDLSAERPVGVGWGELVRGEVEAANADVTPTRVVLARLAPKRHLAVVVTRRGVDPRAILAWILDPTATPPPCSTGSNGPVDTDAPTVDLPATLRNGDTPSGSAGTVHLPHTAVHTGLADSLGVSVEAVLAAAVAILLARYRSRPDVDLLVEAPLPVSVPVLVNEHEWVRDLVYRLGRNIIAGRPVSPEFRATVAVKCPDAAENEAIGRCIVTPVCVSDGRARHELAIALSGRAMRVDYDVALFDIEAVTTFAQRLQVVLGEMKTKCRIRDITALTANEREALASWSSGPVHDVEDLCLHTLVERRAAATPDAVAVVCGDGEVTYGGLNLGANRIAHRLRTSGIGVGDLVALLADRDIHSIVAMLGVLKSGAAYVPIEPSYPAERIRQIVLDSAARLVLLNGPLKATLPVPLLDLSDVKSGPEHNPAVQVEPTDLAYVIYTSGSTGLPKGVAVPHRSIVVSTHARRIGGRPPERDLVTMALCFDGAAGGLFWTLTGGGTVVLPSEAELRDPAALGALLHRTPITHIHSVPSHYNLILQVASQGLGSLRLASVGGEPMPPKLVARHFLECPNAMLLNDYGPTECAVWATAHRCDITDATRTTIPIGHPLPNYRVHVLDDCFRPVPPGLAGEIYIGGSGVVRGYHRRPALTAEQFLPNPFGADGDRIYRTGDRGMWSTRGDLHILGRIDRQVKLRGFRVELAEIETAMRSHPAVADCVVTVRSGVNGVDQVIAFVASTEARLTEAELRGGLDRLLPVFMHPNRFVVLAELPRGPSGKVDPQLLPDLDLDGTHRP